MHIIRRSNLPGSKVTFQSRIHQERKNEEKRSTIPTGSKNLDALLGGGVKTGEVTEFHGASFVGKTQLCYGLCVFASQCGGAIYIDTEGPFRLGRIGEIAEERGYDPDLVLRNTKYLSAYTCYEQEKYLASGSPSKLIVVDSVIANYKAEYSGRGNLSKRQQRLYTFMNNLNKIANVYNIAVVITNHINEIPDMNEFYAIKPAGGNVMGYNITHRIRMERRLGRYLVSIYASKYLLDTKSTCYSIGHGGIKDY